ncbi:unnamed protein product [Prunus armeniaca]
MLAQENEDGKENAVYYLSQTLVGKLRHYILSWNYFNLQRKSSQISHGKASAFWAFGKMISIVLEFKIKYVSQKAIKGQTLVDFLAAHPMPNNMELPNVVLDEELERRESRQAWCSSHHQGA